MPAGVQSAGCPQFHWRITVITAATNSTTAGFFLFTPGLWKKALPPHTSSPICLRAPLIICCHLCVTPCLLIPLLANPQVVLYHGLTGQLQAVLGTHDGLVYSISWASDDSALVTTSADLTAKVFKLPHLGPQLGGTGMVTLLGSRSHGHTFGVGSSPTKRTAGAAQQLTAAVTPMGQQCGVTSDTGTSPQLMPVAAALAGEGACTGMEGTLRSGGDVDVVTPSGDDGVTSGVITLQHACYVYCAEFCPQPGLGAAVVVTGGYDGALRLWDAGRGLLLFATQVGGWGWGWA